MTRGLTTDNRRTSYCEIGFHLQDIIVFSLMATSLAVFVTGLIRG